MNFKQNNLSSNSSAYLQSYKNDPVWWQEWSSDVLEYAKESKKPIFVFVGSLTSHWCDVMNQESFVNEDIVSFLNEHFVCILVDKKQRPDIDSYMTQYLVSVRQTVGYPLTTLLTPTGKPFFCGMYFPRQRNDALPGFFDVLQKTHEWYLTHKEQISEFKLRMTKKEGMQEFFLVPHMFSHTDLDFHGFGEGQKFIPYTSLLFLQNYQQYVAEEEVIDVVSFIEQTFKTSLTSALFDNLEGGIYTHCMKRDWSVPSFEKTLLDQSMLLWNLALFLRYGNKKEEKMYVDILHKTILFLDNVLCNRDVGLYTDAFAKNLYSSEKGIHDEVIFVKENALLGIAFIELYRTIKDEELFKKAKKIANTMLKVFVKEGILYHSSYEGMLQKKQEFVSDYAAIVLFFSYMYEETGNYKIELEFFIEKLESFYHDEIWMESNVDDFQEMVATEFDQPYFSSESLATFAVCRAKSVLGENAFDKREYKKSYYYDGYNLAMLYQKQLIHIVYSPQKIDWKELPLHTIQIHSETYKHEFDGTSASFSSQEALLDDIKNRKRSATAKENFECSVVEGVKQRKA